MDKKQHAGLNILKGISCIIVVFLHVRFPAPVGKFIDFFLHFPVPIFFMISGYFNFFTTDIKKFQKKAIYFLKLILVFEIFYILFGFVNECIINGWSVNEFLASIPLLNNPIKALVFGPVYSGVLWYLYVAFKVCLVYIVLVKYELLSKRYIYLLIPVLCLTHVLLRVYINNNSDPVDYIFLFRSAILQGIPMTLLGSWIRKNEDKVLKNLTKLKSVLLLVVGFLLAIGEYIVSKMLFEVTGSDFHISTVIVSFSLFVFFLHYPSIRYPKSILYIGEKLYTWVYLTHMLLAPIVSVFAVNMGVENNMIFRWLQPIIVVLLSCLCGVVINKCMSLFINRQNSKNSV